ncbi:monooxygenase [Pseudomonas putida]|uniref:NtaA/DmoA family FMN-dependent monooxygenase n=1 Tax=Pseudomonas TaxID=286 RepID=UPI0006D466BE|nr:MULTISPECIES: NtaA/DmoA family FMN-dependent monooxygenase [Pseudomonas]KTC24953.1 monooxygenase [Pseudomonas putida]MBG8558994.1 NtaA/DmoA family FMN-dependent monooxygenase [Pseudomonas qingdaonensis]MCP8347665.1 LLM class flavin-dependent oxidoreductase [Pseudomonas sp. FBF18]MDD1953617.1 NtaA/DmoA family FMN-dependent monooxygenase [Pseudomonas sp. 8209]MEC6742882.1 NtaA/DmoA family FMN-dependent monooxygenase [Pseudomonas qingdaonensis]
MTSPKRLHIGLSLAPTWLSGDAWRRADSNVEGLFTSAFAIDLAQRAEAAHLDFVFRPDVSCLPVEMLESGPGFTSLDPTILLAAVAQQTSHIGLVSTVSTTFYPPYVVARQLQSLNWISNGRVGWNIVTALQGHENFGLEQMPDADERYARAAEFTELVHQLWGSFPFEALTIDRANGCYADTTQVRPVNHEGTYLKVKGPLNLPAFPGTRIPLIQAGASESGRDFAASVADLVFAPTPDKEAALELRRDLGRRAERHGRSAQAIRLLPGLSLYLADTREQARAVFMQTHGRMNRARKLASIKEMTGLDLADWPLDRPVTRADLPVVAPDASSRTHSSLLRRLIERESLSIDQLLLRPEVISAAHWQVVGTVDDAFEQIADWAASGAIDGFIAAPGGSVESLNLFLDQLMPRLVQAGLFRKGYSGSTFAHHLDEQG